MTTYVDRQYHFIPLTGSRWEQHPLIVHGRYYGGRDILFLVHGLQGERYSYWGKLPELLYDHFPELSLALFDYPTLFRREVTRLRRLGSVPLERQVKLLADALIDATKEYDSIYIVAHSMGGLLTMNSLTRIASLGTEDGRAALSKVKLLILADVPMLGAGLATKLKFLPFDDISALQTLGPWQYEILSGWANYFSSKPIPEWRAQVRAARAEADSLVPLISATIGIPDSEIRGFSLTHGALVRPNDQFHPFYMWLSALLRLHSVKVSLHRDLTDEVLSIPKDSDLRRVLVAIGPQLINMLKDENQFVRRFAAEAAQGIRCLESGMVPGIETIPLLRVHGPVKFISESPEFQFAERAEDTALDGGLKCMITAQNEINCGIELIRRATAPLRLAAGDTLTTWGYENVRFIESQFGAGSLSESREYREHLLAQFRRLEQGTSLYSMWGDAVLCRLRNYRRVDAWSKGA